MGVVEVRCQKRVSQVNKLIIDIKSNETWVLESVLVRELFPSLEPNATDETRYVHIQERKNYIAKLKSLEYIELLSEFNKKLGHKYELTNLTDEQVKQLEGK